MLESDQKPDFNWTFVMPIKSILLVIALSLAATGTVYGSWIFKWTDEQGNVHYGDRPTGAADEQRLEIQSRPTNAARVQGEMQAMADLRAERAEEEANAPPGPAPEELRAAALERNEKCNMYRERQTEFLENRRIYRMDDDGERIYYDEAEMQAARDRVQDQVTEFCS